MQYHVKMFPIMENNKKINLTHFLVQKTGIVKPVQPIQPMSQQAGANQATLQEQGQQQSGNSQQKKKQKDDSDDEFIKGKK